MLWGVDQLPMTIIAGPLLPEKDWRELQNTARELPSLCVERSVPDLGAELAKVRWAVCRCGYNTAVDVFATGVSALLVPGINGPATAQTDLLQRLGRWRIARAMIPHHLNGATLASSIQQLTKFVPFVANFNLDGAEISANIIYNLSLSDDFKPDQITSSLADHRRLH